jgi:hypothetical protein
MPFTLEELGLSAEEIAALNAGGEIAEPEEVEPEAVAPGEAETAEEPEVAPFTLEDESLALLDVDEQPEEAESTGHETTSLDELDEELQPFSFDDLGLPTDVLTEQLSPEEESKLGLGEDYDFGFSFGDTGDSDSTDTAQPVDAQSDDPLDNLLNAGQRQGFVELIDIIKVVDDPESESDRIEEIAWALHRAGVEIRDRGEVINMDELAEEEGASDEEQWDSFDQQFTPGGIDAAEPGDAAPPPPEEAQPKASPSTEARPTRQLSPEELEQAEPDIAPLSLEELGLSAEEISMLGLASSETEGEAAGEGADVPAEPAEDVSSQAGISEEAEPDIAPLSLEELGLSAEEIAMLGLASSDAESQPGTAKEETEAAFEDLGLTDEQLARLSQHASTSAPSTETSSQQKAPPAEPSAEEMDMLDFDLGDEVDVPPPPVKRTQPRQEEKAAPPPSAEDLAFEPESLDALDDIWDAPDPSPVEEPARVVLPPREPAPERDRSARRESPRERQGDARRGASARRTPPPPRRPAEQRGGRAAPSASASRGPARPSAARGDVRRPAPAPAAARGARRPSDTRQTRRDDAEGMAKTRSFYPTGNEALDEYLQQLEAEPSNQGLRMAIARMAMQSGHSELGFHEYRQLIKDDSALDQVEDELLSLIDETEEPALLKRLHRCLGDCYSRQKRFREAMAEYNWTFNAS